MREKAEAVERTHSGANSSAHDQKSMTFLLEDPRDWIPELAVALKSIATVLQGEELTPARVFAAGPKFVDAVPGHRVLLHYYERGYLNDPDLDDPGEPEYVISIESSPSGRMSVGWLIAAVDLARVLGQADIQ